MSTIQNELDKNQWPVVWITTLGHKFVKQKGMSSWPRLYTVDGTTIYKIDGQTDFIDLCIAVNKHIQTQYKLSCLLT